MKMEIVNNIKRNNSIMTQLVGHLNDEELMKRTGDSNTIAWIIGHVVYTRFLMIKMLGGDSPVYDYEQQFKRGAEKDITVKLNRDEMLKAYEDRGIQVVDLIEKATDEKLSEPIQYKFPDGSKDLLGGLSFLTWHESFHHGQIDLIKAATGLGGIK